MTHVSRTHRKALGWLFVRINLDPMIQEKLVDTDTQIADVPTKGPFTREKWNILIRLSNIINQTSFSCIHEGSFRSHVVEAM